MKYSGLMYMHDKAENIKIKFIKALPVILFFLAMFYSVILLFGSRYIMVVTLSTLIFQNNYRKQHTPGSLLLLIGRHMLLLVLAFTATWNIPLCIFLNLAVPFWLIFTQSSQFNQLGYFSGLMTFTFLQLMPVTWHEFLIQAGAMLFCCLFLFLIVLIYSRAGKSGEKSMTEQQCMGLLGDILTKALEKEEIDKDLSRLFELQRTLYREAYQKRGKKHVVTTEGKLKYMFALLMQRSAYFVSGQSSVLSPASDESRAFAFQLADYLREASKTDFMGGDTARLDRKGRKLLHQAELHKRNEFYKSVSDFFRMFLLILHQIDIKDRGILSEKWEIPPSQKLKERFLYRLRPDSFEMRFALRMSVVLIFGMVFNMLFYEAHSYWLVMNAFLLLRPMYEDSNYRMRTRFIGTAIGCVCATLILQFCGGIPQFLLIAGVMVACMYTATPGTIAHAVFVTIFALTMTTMAMGDTSAVPRRMIYVMAAVLLVLIVNRFFFPTSFVSQIRYNFQLLFHMHHMYLRLLENALETPLDYWRICDAQIQYHMVHAQIRQDLPKGAHEEEEYYLKLLAVTWRMASEIHQMLFLVTRKKRDAQARRIMERYIYFTDYILNQIQEMLHLKKEKKSRNIEGMEYQRFIEGEPELSRVMTRYARNLSRLYVLVLRRYR